MDYIYGVIMGACVGFATCLFIGSDNPIAECAALAAEGGE